MPFTFGIKRIALAMGCTLLLSGCPAIATGVNNSTAAYPTPDADGKVQLTYAAPESVTKVTFKVVENAELTAEDDSVSDGFNASFDTTSLASGLYTVQIFYDGEESAPAATLAFVKPNSVETQSTASGDETETDGGTEAGNEADAGDETATGDETDSVDAATDEGQ